MTRRDVLASLAAAAAPQDLHRKTLEEAAGLVRRRAISPVELTKLSLSRVERLNPKLNAFIAATAETALSGARAAEKEITAGRWRGPLHGIPVALKDLFDTAGVRTTAASRQFLDRVPTEDAEVVRRLKRAGAVVLGKLNMDEFAYNFTSETSHFGPSRNPWDPRRTPGGSSGGSAIAVSAGMCFAALGSDTGGSIRLPASFCGITGLKPSYGRVPTDGVVPLAWSLDHVGPMCRSARDARIVLGAIDGVRPGEAVETRRVRLGVPKGPGWEAGDSEVKDLVAKASTMLGGLCAGIREVELPTLTPAPQLPVLPLTYLKIIQAEAFAFHEEMLSRSPDGYHASTRRSIENGAKVGAGEYARALREMERLRSSIRGVFENVDLVLTPTAPGVAFELGSTPDLVFLRNTAPWNLYGLPTISVPCGFTAAGLPVGLQMTAAAGRDGLVLQLAVAYQQATDWHRRYPPV
jgi:aspartyl-tRNA(Asn)/glutamyl-tRNA(Gln) amidotransferase subunit A